jgi:ribosome assembly protein YihI (activator of Der GTPase)
MDNLTKTNEEFAQKLANLEIFLQELQAFIDQKINHIESGMENLELRINNLR